MYKLVSCLRLELKDINTIKKYRLKTDCDHSFRIEASIAAVSIGAEIIEKHLTINKKVEVLIIKQV